MPCWFEQTGSFHTFRKKCHALRAHGVPAARQVHRVGPGQYDGHPQSLSRVRLASGPGTLVATLLLVMDMRMDSLPDGTDDRLPAAGRTVHDDSRMTNARNRMQTVIGCRSNVVPPLAASFKARLVPSLPRPEG